MAGFELKYSGIFRKLDASQGMKVVFQSLTLALAFAISVTGVEGNSRTIPYSFGGMAQGLEAQKKEQVLEIAVPSLAIVSLKPGSSYTGALTAFNSRNLTIAAGGYSKTFSLSQIKQVEFQGDVWIVTPDGTRKRLPIRGIPIPLEVVPVTAFQLENPPHRAKVNLETVLSREEFERLSSPTDRIHVVKKILFVSPEKMTISIVAAKR
jgi:hypothetical protein